MVKRDLNRSIAAVSLSLAFMSCIGNGDVRAEDLIVSVSGVESTRGEIGCAVFGTPNGFPMDTEGATIQRYPATPEGVECHFKDLAPGSYAVAVAHDLNGNRRTDTNFIGSPTEAWGVSNNVRPTLRAPTFQEAAFQLAKGQALRLAVKVAR